jgi:hypothetical protein
MTLNENRGPQSTLLTQEDIKLFGATPINPAIPIKKVFIFPIQNALAEGKTVYDATRYAWDVNLKYQSLPAYAVGVKNRISVGSFLIREWIKVNDKHEFNGEEDNTLINRSWRNIISRAKGYWQRGNYLIVEFDGNGKYKIIRGGGEQNTEWFDCIPPENVA